MKTNSMMKKSTLPLIFASTCLSAHSAVVITGVTATTSTSYVHSTVYPANLVNNSGLSVADSITATHAAFGGASPGNGWHSNGGAVDSEFITLNLNGTYDLANIYIWQMNQVGLLGRGVRRFDLLVSTNGTDFTEVASNLELAQSVGGGAESAQAFALNQTAITHVRIGIDTAWSGTVSEYVGLNEVKFTVVPEPAAALLGGLGILNLLRRRRA